MLISHISWHLLKYECNLKINDNKMSEFPVAFEWDALLPDGDIVHCPCQQYFGFIIPNLFITQTGLSFIIKQMLSRQILIQNASTVCQMDHGSHYTDVIIGAIASQFTSLTIVYSIDYSDADQRRHQSSASLAFVREIHRGPVNSPHKWPVTRKMFPFDDVTMHPGLPLCRGSISWDHRIACAQSESRCRRTRARVSYAMSSKYQGYESK